MPKKPAAKNAYYYYMLDFREEQRKNGINYGSLADVSEAASPGWKNATPEVRAKYEEKAKKSKTAMKFTSFGEPISHVLKKNEDKKLQEEMERKTIDLIVHHRGNFDDRLLVQYYAVDVNYYCKCNIGNEEKYVVCEMTLLRFSLVDGVIDEHHMLINPGYIPQGYTSDAKLACEQMGFELPDPAEPSDYRWILVHINEYLALGTGKPPEKSESAKKDESAKKEEAVVFPPLFTMPNKVAAVQSFFSQLCDICGEREERYRIYKIDTLYFHLANADCKGENDLALPKLSLALVQLNRDPFQYHTNLACDFHENNEKFVHCTASRVKRWAYTILDHCCPIRGVEVIPGKHLPDNIDVERILEIKEEQSERRAASVKNSNAPPLYGSEYASSYKWDTCSETASSIGKPASVTRRPMACAKPPQRLGEEYPNLGATSRGWGRPPQQLGEEYPNLGAMSLGSAGGTPALGIDDFPPLNAPPSRDDSAPLDVKPECGP